MELVPTFDIQVQMTDQELQKIPHCFLLFLRTKVKFDFIKTREKGENIVCKLMTSG